MAPAHARLLCQLARAARERGLQIWAGETYRSALQRICRPSPRLIADSELSHRCYGLRQQLGHVGMLWLDDERVVCRLESISVGVPSSRFPGPERVRCVVMVDRPEQGNVLRRKGWAAVLARDLQHHFRRAPLSPPRSRPARETQAEVAAIEPCSQDAYRMTLTCAFVAEAARAGQFMLLECVTPSEKHAFRRAKNRPWKGQAGPSVDPKLPLLRRPFGFHRFSGPDYAPDRLCDQPPFTPDLMSIIEPGRGTAFDLLFKVVGRGTQRLAQMRPGEKLSLRAPLGTPVEIREHLDTAVLVAGGMGAGPLFAIAQELRRQGRKVHVVLGAQDRVSAPVNPGEFEAMGAKASLVTEREDGMLATDYLRQHLEQMTEGSTEVFACGPVAMLREVASIASLALPVQVLMEQRMACGMGLCRGCVVRMRSPRPELAQRDEGEPIYRTVCREGPAFRAEEVAWEELAATVG